jgi:hypothetical protein
MLLLPTANPGDVSHRASLGVNQQDHQHDQEIAQALSRDGVLATRQL